MIVNNPLEDMIATPTFDNAVNIPRMRDGKGIMNKLRLVPGSEKPESNTVVSASHINLQLLENHELGPEIDD